MMMNNARAAYMDASVATGDPSRLLVMLCDRLVLDVERGLVAQRDGSREVANQQLTHAQSIVLELRVTLDTDGFDGAQQLAALYDHLYQRLIAANVHQDEETTEHCLGIVRGIADTWRQAAVLQLGQTA